MNQKPVLVILAAGMGSRYGGLKQIDPVGSHGEAILDYSLYDAHQAGFETAVIIIKKAIETDFMDSVGARLKNCPMEIRYAYQELDKALPENFRIPEARTKPWGTSHAVLCARDAIGGAPFAVINSDDYYGKTAFQQVYNALLQLRDDEKQHYCMVGYLLGNTVTEHGAVARGVCHTDETGYLTAVEERTRIEKYAGGIHFTLDGENWTDLAPDTVVSMNLWGFTPGFLEEVRQRFPVFLNTTIRENPEKGEFFLPVTVGQLLRENKADVRVFSSPDKWYGVTYSEDKPQVIAALRRMTEEGLYPDGLWG